MSNYSLCGILLIMVVNVVSVHAGAYPRPRPFQEVQVCSNSVLYPADQCCRKENGEILVDDRLWGLAAENGTCSTQPSGPGQICSSCGCVKGYTCYSSIGSCFMSPICWRNEDAQRDRELYANCIPPKCHLPMCANLEFPSFF